MSTGTSFPELPAERARFAFARAARDRMIDRLERVDPDATADEFTKEYVEVTVAEALESLRSPGAGDFFGRIDEPRRGGGVDQWYIGRRHIEDDTHDPVVVDWRAPISAPFYRATAVDPLGMSFRRRFTLDEGELIAYLDEDLDDPSGGEVASGVPDPVLAEIGAARSGAMREIVATIQAEQDVVIRSPIDQALIVQGGPGTGKTAVALHRAAYLLFEHRGRLAHDGVLVVGPNRAFLDYIANVLPSLGERAVRQCTALDLCLPKVEIGGVDDQRDGTLEGFVRPARGAGRGGTGTDRAPGRRRRRPDRSPHGGVHAGRGGDLARHRQAGGRADQPASRATPGAGPPSAPPPHRFRRGVVARRAVEGGVEQGLADPATGAAGRPDAPRSERQTSASGRPPTSSSSTRPTRCSTAHRSPTATSIVDEAQDHSAVALRVIGRRSPSGSMTLVGDVAQSTTPAGQENWRDVFANLAVRGSVRGSTRSAVDGAVSGSVAVLTIGYRVPEPILEIANRLLPLTGVDAVASRSVRGEGAPPAWHTVSPDELRDVDRRRRGRRSSTGTG